MKILYVITKANWGGAQRYVYDLATAAQAAGSEVVVAYGEHGVLAEKLRAAGVRAVMVRGLARDVGFLREFSALAGLTRFFRTEKPDVVHLNSSKAGALGALAARLAGVPHILFTSHGWAFNEDRTLVVRVLLYLAAGVTVLLSHETLCNSEATYRAMRHFPFAKRKLVVIPLGIDCTALLPRDTARAELSPPSIGKYWIGMISELHPTKRVGDAIRAMALVTKAHPEALLVVIGEGEERQKLTYLIRDLGLGSRVYLAGFRPDASRLLGAFDLFLHTSRSESFGYAIAEAGCASLPVVAARVGAVPELIPDDDHGLLVPPENPEAAAGALDALIQDGARAHELGARLHARITTHFTKQKMVAATLARYR